MQIIILGMHRSGTSMVTRLVNMLGAYIGPESMMLEFQHKKLNSGNAKGHWERRDVMNINDSILAEYGGSWDRPSTPLNADDDIISDEISEAIKLCLYGLDMHRPWAMKDPRLCLTLPYWKRHMEVPVVIVVTRNPAEIALSLEQRNGVPHAKSMALWEYYMASALNASLDVPRIFVDHSQIIQRPQTSTEGLLGWLSAQGCRRLDMPSAKEISAFIDPSLYRAKTADNSIGFTNTNQQQLWQILQGHMPQVGYIQCSDASVQQLAGAA